MIKTILLDMDGVCVDFIRPACRLHGRDPGEVMADWEAGSWDICEPLGLTPTEFWEPITMNPEFWQRLPEYSWFRNLWKLLESYCEDIVFLTSPSRCPTAHFGKAKWLQARGYCPARKAMLGSRKELLAKPGNVLVDDSDENCRKFAEAGGAAVLFPQWWNSRHGQSTTYRTDEGLLSAVEAGLLSIYRFGFPAVAGSA